MADIGSGNVSRMINAENNLEYLILPMHRAWCTGPISGTGTCAGINRLGIGIILYAEDAPSRWPCRCFKWIMGVVI